MSPLNLLKKQIEQAGDQKFHLKFNGRLEIEVYSNSINRDKKALFLIGRNSISRSKNLFIISEKENLSSYDNFEGEIAEANGISENLFYKKNQLNHHNAVQLQSIFSFTKPVVIGLSDSFGYGDRLGMANPGHAQVALQHDFKSIFAQQSIRELTRTKRSPEEVMDAAVWAVFQEGYKEGFGADADHLKTKEHVDLLMNAGFTFFTIDSGDYVDNNSDNLSEDQLLKKIKGIDFNPIKESAESILNRYQKQAFNLGDGLLLTPSTTEILTAIAKYGKCFIHIKNLTAYMKEHYSDRKYEVEISIDETFTHTTPFDHFFIVNELKKLEIDFVSIAPHFVGSFEKGIDYKKDLNEFSNNFKMHSLIAKYFGGYKISFHSGSDKFSIYKKVGEVKDRSPIHIKTAGTSYLIALQVIAMDAPDLFRKILDYSVEAYKVERESYHVSANLDEIKSSDKYSDEELPGLFTNESARQVLHVTFGKVLTDVDSKNNYLFKDKIRECLDQNEELHYQLLVEHFNNHLNPFEE